LASDSPGLNFSGNQPFEPLPPPVGVHPFHVTLGSVLGATAVAAIQSRGRVDFHVMGDTGGINNPTPQQDVAFALEADLKPATAANAFSPSFLYLLGDCVYFNGQPSQYYGQFFEPYTHYTAPIFAVPGNHDGDPIDATQSTLDGFLQAFCTLTPQNIPASRDSGRTTMTQPNVYWTLEAPFATVIGLYTNVPEHGRLDDTQIAWLHQELAAAPAKTALLVTMHHPPLSGDDHHGSSQYMLDLLDAAMRASGRVPTLILAGHVHNYQRFSRTLTVNGTAHTLPYVVGGAGGYHNMHTMAADAAAAHLPWPMPTFPGVTLEAFNDTHYGYARLTATATSLSVEYVAVAPPPGVDARTMTPTIVDTFTINL
jgi:hypothetical protein